MIKALCDGLGDGSMLVAAACRVHAGTCLLRRRDASHRIGLLGVFERHGQRLEICDLRSRTVLLPTILVEKPDGARVSSPTC